MARSIIQWICRGIHNKKGELNLIISEFNPVVMAFQETHTTPHKLPKISHYQIHHKPFPHNKACGGVAIAVRDGYFSEQILLNTSLQAIAVKVSYPRKFTICSLYLPNQKWTQAQLQSLIQELPPPFLLLGDFNSHNPLWGATSIDSHGKIIEKILGEENLVLLNIGDPTYIDDTHGTYSALDLAISSPTLAPTFNWSVAHDTFDSDHFPILLQISDDTSPKTCRPKWKLEQADWNLFEQTIETEIPVSMEADISLLVQGISKAASVSIPKTKGKIHPHPVYWWNDTVRAAVKARRKALRKHLRTPEDHPEKQTRHAVFRRKRNEARKAIFDAQVASWRSFISGITSDTPPKEVWRRIRALKGGKNSIPTPTISHNGQNHSSPEIISEILADHFEHVTSDENYDPLFLERKRRKEQREIRFSEKDNEPYNRPFSTEELLFQLDSVKGSSLGPDDIHYDFLKRLPFYAKRKLLEAYNKIWASGKFPEEWKEAIIVRIPKSGKDNRIPSNQRPILLTSCACKILERMVNRHLMSEIEHRNLLSPNQYAFRKGRSIVDHLTTLENDIQSAFHDKEHLKLISLDISKAYDMTWRRPILKTLAKWGFGGNMTRFLEDFLRHRSFRVMVGGKMSSPHTLHTGVFQGSVLSVSFFLIAINSIVSCIPQPLKILIYADDILVYWRSKDVKLLNKTLQNGLHCIERWSNKTGFKISQEKTMRIHFCRQKLGTHTVDYPLKICSKTITETNFLRILGVFFDTRLSWNSHIKHLKESTSKSLNVIRCISGTIGAARKWILHIHRALASTRRRAKNSIQTTTLEFVWP